MTSPPSLRRHSCRPTPVTVTTGASSINASKKYFIQSHLLLVTRKNRSRQSNQIRSPARASPWSAPPCRRFGQAIPNKLDETSRDRRAGEAAPSRRGPKRRRAAALQGGVPHARALRILNRHVSVRFINAVPGRLGRSRLALRAMRSVPPRGSGWEGAVARPSKRAHRDANSVTCNSRARRPLDHNPPPTTNSFSPGGSTHAAPSALRESLDTQPGPLAQPFTFRALCFLAPCFLAQPP